MSDATDPHLSSLISDFSFDLIRLPNRRYRFDSELLHADADLLVLRHTIQPSKPFVFRGEEVIGPGYEAVWFLFQGEPYDIGRFYRPDGTWTGYYVDMLEPVRWVLEPEVTLEPLVDLFLDLWIAPDGTYTVLDEEELAQAITSAAITADQEALARGVLKRLVTEVQQGRFPPDQVRHPRRDFRPISTGDPGP
jgi:predicted RNA-binding protein associated with RNAse of E/G family